MYYRVTVLSEDLINTTPETALKNNCDKNLWFKSFGMIEDLNEKARYFYEPDFNETSLLFMIISTVNP